MPVNMSSRSQFFSTILSKFGQAAAKGFSSLSAVVEDLKLPRQFAELPDPVHDGSVCNAGVDCRGVTLYPKDAPLDLTPTRVTGDGSCFYNACSVALYKTEAYSKELRVRTVIELVSSINYYSSDPLPYLTGVSGTVSEAGLLDTFLSDNARRELISNGREAALKQEVINTCKETSWANILHFPAMANVISAPLQSIFPEHSQRIRPYYNRTFYPKDWNQQQNDKPSVFILWCGNLRSTVFVTDHFVPCMKKSGGTTSVTSMWGVILNQDNELELWRSSLKTGDKKVLGTIFQVEKCADDSDRIKIIWTNSKCERILGRFLMSLFKRHKATPSSLVKGCTRDNFQEEVTRLLNAGVSESTDVDIASSDNSNDTPQTSPMKDTPTDRPMKKSASSGGESSSTLLQLEFRQQVYAMRDILLQSNGIEDEDAMKHDCLLDRNAKGYMLTKELTKETGLKVHELNRFKTHKFVASLSKRCYRLAENVMDRWEAGDIPGQPSKAKVTQTIFCGMSGLKEEICYQLLSNLSDGDVTWTEHKHRVLQHKEKDNLLSKEEWEKHRQALESRIRILKNDLSTARYEAPKEDVQSLESTVTALQVEKEDLTRKLEAVKAEKEAAEREVEKFRQKWQKEKADNENLQKTLTALKQKVEEGTSAPPAKKRKNENAADDQVKKGSWVAVWYEGDKEDDPGVWYPGRVVEVLPNGEMLKVAFLWPDGEHLYKQPCPRDTKRVLRCFVLAELEVEKQSESNKYLVKDKTAVDSMCRAFKRPYLPGKD